MKCPRCGREDIIYDEEREKYQCYLCGKWFVEKDVYTEEDYFPSQYSDLLTEQ